MRVAAVQQQSQRVTLRAGRQRERLTRQPSRHAAMLCQRRRVKRHGTQVGDLSAASSVGASVAFNVDIDERGCLQRLAKEMQLLQRALLGEAKHEHLRVRTKASALPSASALPLPLAFATAAAAAAATDMHGARQRHRR